MGEPLEKKPVVAVVGSGPAGLMAAFVAAKQGCEVHLFEKRRGAGRKLLIAGSSGLNITYDCPLEEFVTHYSGPRSRFQTFLQEFSPAQWIEFIEALGIPTFKGTSRRYFVEGMKASHLLRAWVDALQKQGTTIHFDHELRDFQCISNGRVRLDFAAGSSFQADAVCLSFGGGSYEEQEVPLRWPEVFKRKGLVFHPFEASNVGFQVDWPAALLTEAEGKPIKNVVLSSSRASRSGDLVITRYGVEGTPVYFAGEVGTVYLDLKPDLSPEKLLSKLTMTKENLSPMRRVKRFLNLSEGALALIFHLTPKERLGDLSALVAALKKFPLQLLARQPLAEAISSSGGLSWAGVSEQLELVGFPGVFVAGEMLDWDAPTGGFLIQGCVSQGFVAGTQAAIRARHCAGN
jgi:hypothetical protein